MKKTHEKICMCMDCSLLTADISKIYMTFIWLSGIFSGPSTIQILLLSWKIHHHMVGVMLRFLMFYKIDKMPIGSTTMASVPWACFTITELQ